MAAVLGVCRLDLVADDLCRGHAGGALPRRLECPGQGGRRRPGHAGLRAGGSGGDLPVPAALPASAGAGQLAPAPHLGRGSSGLLRAAGPGLPSRRSEPGLSDRPRPGPGAGRPGRLAGRGRGPVVLGRRWTDRSVTRHPGALAPGRPHPLGSASATRRGLAIALSVAIAVSIALYSTADGLGVRRSGSPLSYIAWLLFLEALPFVGMVLWRRARQPAGRSAPHGRQGDRRRDRRRARLRPDPLVHEPSPMAAVAALRETSVIIAAWIGTRMMGEPSASSAWWRRPWSPAGPPSCSWQVNPLCRFRSGVARFAGGCRAARRPRDRAPRDSRRAPSARLERRFPTRGCPPRRKGPGLRSPRPLRPPGSSGSPCRSAGSG